MRPITQPTTPMDPETKNIFDELEEVERDIAANEQQGNAGDELIAAEHALSLAEGRLELHTKFAAEAEGKIDWSSRMYADSEGRLNAARVCLERLEAAAKVSPGDVGSSDLRALRGFDEVIINLEFWRGLADEKLTGAKRTARKHSLSKAEADIEVSRCRAAVEDLRRKVVKEAGPAGPGWGR